MRKKSAFYRAVKWESALESNLIRGSHRDHSESIEINNFDGDKNRTLLAGLPVSRFWIFRCVKVCAATFTIDRALWA